MLSAANWAYTWLEPGRDTDELADRFLAILVDGIRGYATPRDADAMQPPHRQSVRVRCGASDAASRVAGGAPGGVETRLTTAPGEATRSPGGRERGDAI